MSCSCFPVIIGTVLMFIGILPGIPAWPGEPPSPFRPGEPGWPGNPGSPLRPGGPGVPRWPRGAGSPFGPGRPGRPGVPLSPATLATILQVYVSIIMTIMKDDDDDDARAELQRCLVTGQFSSSRLHWLTIVCTFVHLNFKTPAETYLSWAKNYNNDTSVYNARICRVCSHKQTE